MRRWLPPATGIAALITALAALELAGAVGWTSPFVAPRPSTIAIEGWRMASTEPLVSAFMRTFGVALAATIAAAALGIPAGWAMFRFPVLGLAYENWVAALFCAPLILLYPLFLVLFGRGPLTIGMIGFLSGVVPMVLKTYEGFSAVPKVLVNVARSFKLPESAVLYKVLLPAALPSVFTGLRLAFIYATINVVALEYLVNFGGLGFLVGRMYDTYNIPAMYAAVAFVLLISVLGFWLVERLERRLGGGA
ncbi:MAG: ABC transporter permease subunit [Burkholderiales bacterium]|nr:ABC transporter permease subunit [Burkholderiales bacterium]